MKSFYFLGRTLKLVVCFYTVTSYFDSCVFDVYMYMYVRTCISVICFLLYTAAQMTLCEYVEKVMQPQSLNRLANGTCMMYIHVYDYVIVCSYIYIIYVHVLYCISVIAVAITM